MKKLTLFVAIIFTSSLSFSHGIHDSGNAKPLRGGLLRSLETVHLELVRIDNQIRVYVYNKDKKPQSLKTKDYPVSAKVILPRKKESVDIKLIDKGDHWVATYDGRGLHRYTFQFSIEQGGHKDKLSFTIEPKH